MKTKTAQHTHEYKRSNPSATVETCACGKWKHTENAGPSIVEQRAQHTPGPWRAEADIDSGWTIRETASELGKPIAEVWKDDHGIRFFPQGVEGECNARLIAAAPELLEAAKTMRDLIRANGMVPKSRYDSEAWDIWNECLAAIAKAEGGK